jgi:N-acyl-L-homoserine lactone synthetase
MLAVIILVCCDGPKRKIGSVLQVMTSALDLWFASAGFVAQHIRKSCSCKKAGIVALYCPQIPRSQKNLRICGTKLSANPAVAKNEGFVAATTLSANPAVPKERRIVLQWIEATRGLREKMLYLLM